MSSGVLIGLEDEDGVQQPIDVDANENDLENATKEGAIIKTGHYQAYNTWIFVAFFRIVIRDNNSASGLNFRTC